MEGVYLPKQPTGVGLAENKGLKLAEQLGYTLVDVELVKEATGRFLRFFIDKEGGITLSDCENFHRQILKFVEDVDYDYMEVSSPGVDRPLKKDKDFSSAMGERIEVRLYRAVNGARAFYGVLSAFANGCVTIVDDAGQAWTFDKKQIALAKIQFDFDEGLLDVLDEEQSDDIEYIDDMPDEEELEP